VRQLNPLNRLPEVFMIRIVPEVAQRSLKCLAIVIHIVHFHIGYTVRSKPSKIH
jgi:hypothetical protein